MVANIEIKSTTTLLVFVSTLIFNATNGRNIGKIATNANINLLINPASWSFAIWGLIYSLLSIIIVSSFLNETKQLQSVLPQQLKEIKLNSNWNLLFIISCVFNISWILFWTSNYSFNIKTATILLLGTTVSLISLLFTSVKSNITNFTISTYAAWVFFTLSLNITLVLTKSFGVSMHIVAYILVGLLSSFQILWQLINNKSILIKSRGILLTSLWTSTALATNDFKPIKAIPLAATVIAFIINLNKTNLL